MMIFCKSSTSNTCSSKISSRRCLKHHVKQQWAFWYWIQKGKILWRTWHGHGTITVVFRSGIFGWNEEYGSAKSTFGAVGGDYDGYGMPNECVCTLHVQYVFVDNMSSVEYKEKLRNVQNNLESCVSKTLDLTEDVCSTIHFYYSCTSNCLCSWKTTFEKG